MCLGELQLRFGEFPGGEGLISSLSRGGVVGEQRFGAPVVGVGKVALGCSPVALRLEGRRVEREQGIPLAHVGAIREVDCVHAPGDFRGDHDGLVGKQGPDRGELVGVRLDVHFDGFDGESLGFLVLLGGRYRERGEQGGQHEQQCAERRDE